MTAAGDRLLAGQKRTLHLSKWYSRADRFRSHVGGFRLRQLKQFPLSGGQRESFPHRAGGQLTTDNRQQTTNHRPQTTDHRPQNTDHRQQTTDNRPQTTDHRQQTTDNRPQTTDNKPQTTEKSTTVHRLLTLIVSYLFLPSLPAKRATDQLKTDIRGQVITLSVCCLLSVVCSQVFYVLFLSSSGSR